MGDIGVKMGETGVTSEWVCNSKLDKSPNKLDRIQNR
jgi:hypothetical protein